ncbi:MAG: protein kinase [Lachnospiraceae bacterium]|nr:protein kinase [Lachnospiraceae bacterium]
MLGDWLQFLKKNQPNGSGSGNPAPEFEYCTNCDANLTLQKGYSNQYPYWICKGCGEMLINPELATETDIIWRCDGCGALLNIQGGFSEVNDEWTCLECGYKNNITESEVYLSEDEYLGEQRNPYRGLRDDDVLALSLYSVERDIDKNGRIALVRDPEDGRLYVRKFMTYYDKTIYEYLKDHPVGHMPVVVALYEGSNGLFIIEEYIEGATVSEMLEKGCLPEKKAIDIARSVCRILEVLHSLPTPIIHRDIKPSNIIVKPDGEVVLLDMNVAKWYDADKTDDTAYMGTQYYAAPEQAGYGFKASSAKTDIYAVGVLLNVMLTGKIPKEQRASGPIWDIIERCIRLNAEERYTAAELIRELDKAGE